VLAELRLERLWRAGTGALLERGRQELSKSLERFGATAAAPRRELGAALLELPACFFAGVASGRVPELLGALAPDARDRLLDRAAALLEGRFDLLGYRDLRFGDPIDWHLDPCSGRRAPRVHWSRIDPLDHGQVGDSKVVWELNRHQWLVDLGQAYAITGDERYAAHAARQLRAWMAANPPGIGINWSSSLEVALRAIAWCWTIALLRRSAAFDRELCATLVGWLGRHAQHVERYLSRHYSPNTHLTGEALGLYYLGTLFPTLHGAAGWRRLARTVLEEALERQVLPDGIHFERATCYQRYTAEIYLHFMILADRAGEPLAASDRARVVALLDALLALCDDRGRMPAIGDGDGGWLLPLARRDADDARGVLAVAAALFGRADHAWLAGGFAPEAAWLLGPEACDAPAAAKPTTAPSRCFADGGIALMRSAWGRDNALMLDFGPLGCHLSAGHGHADLLAIQCRVAGQAQLVDPGTYCYSADPAWRDHFRASAAHCCLTLDGRSQARPRGTFSWQERPAARLRRWQSTPAQDFVDAEHDAYHHGPDPVRHRRRVLFVKPDYWVMVDDLDGGAVHLVELHFQFAPLTLALADDGWARSATADGHGLALKSFAAAGLRMDIDSGALQPRRGWLAPDYGRLEPAPQLRIAVRCALPLRIVTVLAACNGAQRSPHAALHAVAGGMQRLEVEHAGRRDAVRIDEFNLVLEGAPR